MIAKSPSASWLRWKLLIMLPIMLVIAAAFTFGVEDRSPKLLPLVKCTVDQEDIEAQYACTHKEILIHIYKAVRYPKEARDRSLTGYAILGATFNREGLISYSYVYETDPVFQDALLDIAAGLKNLQFKLGVKEELSLSNSCGISFRGYEHHG